MSCPSSIRHRVLNQLPLEHESCPITTRPGLPPYEASCYLTDFGSFNVCMTLLASLNFLSVRTLKTTTKETT